MSDHTASIAPMSNTVDIEIIKDDLWSPVTWWGLRDGEKVTHIFPTKRLLVAAIEGGYAEPVEGHDLRVGHKTLGSRNIAGFNTPFRGTTARCTCGDWKWATNDKPPSRGGERAAFERWLTHIREVHDRLAPADREEG